MSLRHVTDIIAPLLDLRASQLHLRSSGLMFKQPGTQIKLTNVSIVRLKKAGKRFEIACYKNTVKAYRSGAQTDLSEVIQIDNVFTNVSKGQVAPSDDLQKAFNTTEVQKIMMEILDKGELQVGEKERAAILDDLRREICSEVAARCVDPGTQRPHTTGMIEKAMNEVGYSVKSHKSAKVQALDLIKVLQTNKTLPIARARMRVRVTMPAKEGKKIKDKVLALVAKVEDDEWNDEWELANLLTLARFLSCRATWCYQIALIDPGSFKLIDELLHSEVNAGKGGASAKIEMISFSAVEGEERIE